MTCEASGLGPYPGPRLLHRVGAVEQRLAAQAVADGAGFLDGQGGGLGIALAGKVPGVVEQAVGEMVGVDCSRRLMIAAAKAARRPGRRRCGQPGADQIALGPQHGGDMSGLVGVEQGEQFAGGGGIP